MTNTTTPINFNDPVGNANGGSGGVGQSAGFDGIAPTTTKGDLSIYSTTNARFPLGLNTYALSPDSTTAFGWAWVLPPVVTSVGITSTHLTVTNSPITTNGTITIDLPNSVTGANMLFNPSMELMMRGANQNTGVISISAATRYTCDRWQGSSGAGVVASVKQIAGPTSGSWYAQVQRTSANTGTNPILYSQSLPRDSCIGAAGNTVTFQFQGKCGANYSSGSSLLTVKVYSGTGGSDISGISGAFTGSTLVVNTTVTLTTSFQLFTVTSSALSSSVTQLCVELSYTPVGTASTNDWFGVTNTKLELGSIATPFQGVPNYQVYSDCARFYLKSFAPDTLPAAIVSTSVAQWTASNAAALADPSHMITFFITMRATPTITLFNPSAAGAQARDNTAAATCSATSATASPAGLVIMCTGALTTVAGNQLWVQWTAETELT